MVLFGIILAYQMAQPAPTMALRALPWQLGAMSCNPVTTVNTDIEPFRFVCLAHLYLKKGTTFTCRDFLDNLVHPTGDGIEDIGQVPRSLGSAPLTTDNPDNVLFTLMKLPKPSTYIRAREK
jgi:hypothetical protein